MNCYDNFVINHKGYIFLIISSFTLHLYDGKICYYGGSFGGVTGVLVNLLLQ